MAMISVLLGGVVGFISFLTGLIAFDLSVLSALALYLGVGCAFVVLGFVIHQWPTTREDTDAQTA